MQTFRRAALAVFLGCAALLLLGAAIGGGAADALLVAGLLTGGVGLTGLVSGSVRWARIRGRAVAAVVLCAGMAATLLGGATSAEPTDTLAAAAGPGAAGAAASASAQGTVPSASASSPVPTASGSARPSATHPAPATSPSSRPAATSTTASHPAPTRAPSRAPTATTPAAQRPAAGTAAAALATLAVKGRAPKTGYDRDRFGQAWADTDRNGCDTRNDVLRRDLDRFVLKAGTHGCLVLRGSIHEPYTGRTIDFVRGVGTSTKLQIDHVVALSDAWQKGAQQWSPSKRERFANDPLNLLAVDGPSNESKGDGDAATWLPPYKPFRCAYVARQVAVKVRYGLWVTAAERDAIGRVLQRCPGQKLPQASSFTLGGGPEEAPAPVAARPTPTPTPTPTHTPTHTATAPPAGGTDPHFGTCKEAIAHGYGPYVAGRDAEYAWYRDADKDGVTCER